MLDIYDEISRDRFGVAWVHLSAWNKELVRQSVKTLADQKQLTIPMEETREDQSFQVDELEGNVMHLEDDIRQLMDRLGHIEDRITQLEQERKE